MATSSISGLVSGLNTAEIIEQLMALEAVPQSKLKTKVSTQQSAITAMQTLNTKVSLISSRAEALAKASAWSPVVATSSNNAVTVKAGPTASPTSLNVTVVQTALTHQVASQTPAKLTDSIVGGSGTVRIDRFDGTTVDIESDGTLKGVVDAINAKPDSGLRASAIKVGEVGGVPQYQLFVESTKTGLAEDFQLTDDQGVALSGFTARAGRDAEISLGLGVTVRSSSNTFTGVVDGVDITLGDQATGTATIAVNRDTTSLTSQVQGLVDTLNAALDEIATQTAYNGNGSTAGKLMGDAGVRSLRDQLLNAVFPTDGTSMASLGIQTDRYGKVVFDAAKFREAYAADPVGVSEKFTTENNGFAARLEAVAKTASNSTTGTITMAITGRKSEITRLEESITAWDTRLAMRRTTLERQYTALETAMSQLNSQSSWLSAQVESMNNSSK